VLLVCCTSKKEADRLASLAEAVSGYEVSDTGSLILIESGERLHCFGPLNGARPAEDLSLDWMIRRVTYSKKVGYARAYRADHDRDSGAGGRE
jgi:hypothetical protein